MALFLFLFFLTKAVLASLLTDHFVVLRPLFSFRQAQYVQFFPLKPVLFCKLSAGPGSTNTSAISLLLLFDSHFVLAKLYFPPFFFLLQTFGHICQKLSSLVSFTIRLEWNSGHSFLPGNGAADEQARRGALPLPSATSCILFPLNARIYTCLSSDWRRAVSSKFFDTQMSSISTEELLLLYHAYCILSRLRYNVQSFLKISYLSRIDRNENPSCSTCNHPIQNTSHLIVHYPATDSLRRSLFGDSLSLYDLWSRPWKVIQFLGLQGLPSCLLFSEGIG